MNLEEIEARLAAAMPGPWAWASAPAEGSSETPADYLANALTGDGPLFVFDAEFIVPVLEDIRALLAEVKRLQGELKLLRVMPPAAEQNATLIRLLKEETAALQSEVKRLQAQIDAVKVLHCPDAVQPQYCTECSDFGTDQFPAGELIEWPCPTIQALGGGES